MKFSSSAGAVLLSAASLVSAIELDPNDAASIRSVTRQYTYGLMSHYVNNATDLPKEEIGIFPKPHYWWAAGAAWGGVIEYSQFTGDDSQVKTLQQALTANYGPENNIILPWRKDQQGNDDQAFWAIAIMSALEYQFPDPAQAPASYLEVVENCFQNIVDRWDETTCGGGLKWQIYPENAYGYNYKNSISNGATFALGARLARYTGKQKYADWSAKIYDWTKKVGLISDKFEVFDGTDDKRECATGEAMDETQWSYNLAMFLHGSAYMYDVTKGDDLWKNRVSGFLDHSSYFFKPYDNATDIMYEPACETGETGRHCNLDQQSFKAYLARFMAKTAVMAPFTKDTISNYLKKSAIGAAKSCSGGDDGVTCGSKWYTGGWDGTFGVGQQLSALEVTQALLQLEENIVPVKNGDAQPEPKPESTSTAKSTPKSTPTPTPTPTPAPEPSKPVESSKAVSEVSAVPKPTSDASPQPQPSPEAPSSPAAPSNSSAPVASSKPEAPSAVVSPPASSNQTSPGKPSGQYGEPGSAPPAECTCKPSKTVTVYVPPVSSTAAAVPQVSTSSVVMPSAPVSSAPVPSEPAASASGSPPPPPPGTTDPAIPLPPAEPPANSTTAAGVAPPANTTSPDQPLEFTGAGVNVQVTCGTILGAAVLAILGGLA